MARTSIGTLFVLALAAGAVAGAGQQAATADKAQHTRVDPVMVPTGDGAPVITDGIFTPGEWNDALALPVADSVTLLLKHYRGVVFVDARGAVGPSDLYLAPPGGPIQELHVSAALAQVMVPASGPEPEWRVGFTTDWYANEFRRDEQAFRRMQKEGRDARAINQATAYPVEGIEFAIRRSKLPGQVWLMRLDMSALIGGREGGLTYPPAVFVVPEGPPGAGSGPPRPSLTADRWLELHFK
jgi:hypothetical protein